MNINPNSFPLERASANILINFSLLFTLTYLPCWKRLERGGGYSQQHLQGSCPSYRRILKVKNKGRGKSGKPYWEEIPRSVRGLGKEKQRGNSQSATLKISPKVACTLPLSGFPGHVKEKGSFLFHHFFLPCGLSLAGTNPDPSVWRRQTLEPAGALHILSSLSRCISVISLI